MQHDVADVGVGLAKSVGGGAGFSGRVLSQLPT